MLRTRLVEGVRTDERSLQHDGAAVLRKFTRTGTYQRIYSAFRNSMSNIPAAEVLIAYV